MRRVLPLVASLVLAGPARSQGVHVVAPTGAPFTQIQPAIDAAQHGDVVLVAPGTYSGFVVLEKGVSVVADTGGQVFVTGNAEVRGLAADRDVLLHRLQIVGTERSIVGGCAGSVRLQSSRIEGALSSSALWIEGSSDLALEDCTISGIDGGLASGLHGRDALFVRGSRFALHGCDMRGGDGLVTSCAGGNGGDAVSMQASYGFVGDCLVAGGDGRNANGTGSGWSWPDGGSGGDGLQVSAGWGGPSNAEMFASQLSGGTAGSSAHSCSCQCGFTLCCTGEPGSPGLPLRVLAGGSTAVLFPGASRKFTLGTNPVREQSSVLATFLGEPGDLVVLLVHTETSFEPQPTSRGVRLVPRLGQPFSMIVGTIDATGSLTASFQVPELGPGVGARVVHMQSLHRNAGGHWILGNLVSAVELDQAY